MACVADMMELEENLHQLTDIGADELDLAAAAADLAYGSVAADDEPMPEHLKQNQRVSARILLESRDNVLLVKRGPFLESGGGRFAYIVDGDLATRQRIQIGATSVSSVEILSGLTEWQTIIVSSSREFEDADVVYLTN